MLKSLYDVIYDDYQATYPELQQTVTVDKNSGRVEIKNAGMAVIKVTLRDTREHPVYADAVKYVKVKVNRADLKITSYAEDKDGETNTAQYGTVDSLKYSLKYDGFKNDDNEENFTKNHGTLKAEALNSTLGVSDGEQYEIAILKVGAPIKIGDKKYDNVFLSRNYQLKFINGKIGITPAPLQITAKDVKGTWNIEPKYSYEIDGLMAWDGKESVFEKMPVARLDTGKTGGKTYNQLDPGTYRDVVGVTEGTQNKNDNGKENYTVSTVHRDLTIEKAVPILTVSAVSKTYDGTPANVTATATAEEPLIYDGPNPKLTYYLMRDNSNRPVLGEPVNAGNYRAKATVAESTHFNEATDETIFAIVLATASLLILVAIRVKRREQ